MSQAWGEPRSRTVTWYDPSVSAAALGQMSGREHLQAVADGLLPPPPIGGLMAFGIDEVRDDGVVFRCTPDESAYNPIGAVHGGLVCTLLDSVCGCAVQATLPQGQGYTSIEIKVSYLRAVHATSGELTAVGRVTKPGRRVAFSEGEVRDAQGRLVATASSTCLVFDLPTSVTVPTQRARHVHAALCGTAAALAWDVDRRRTPRPPVLPEAALPS